MAILALLLTILRKRTPRPMIQLGPCMTFGDVLVKRTSESYSSYQSQESIHLLLASICIFMYWSWALMENHQPLPETQDLGEMHEMEELWNWDANPCCSHQHALAPAFDATRSFLAQGCMLNVLRLDACWSFNVQVRFKGTGWHSIIPINPSILSCTHVTFLLCCNAPTGFFQRNPCHFMRGTQEVTGAATA